MLSSLTSDFPHLLFYGPPGAGKKTRVLAFLSKHFGTGVDKLKAEHKAIKVSDSKEVEVALLVGPNHVEVNPSEAGTYDRAVCMSLIKDVASSVAVDHGADSRRFKVIIINDADALSRGAQQALRRTMEKASHNCRIILVANTTGKLIEPLRSRCLGVRVPAPTVEDVAATLGTIAKAEAFALPPDVATAIATGARRNLRRAILNLETCRAISNPLPRAAESVILPDWEVLVRALAEAIHTSQSPQRVLEIRAGLYDVLAVGIPPQLILDTLLRYTLPLFAPPNRDAVVAAAAQYVRCAPCATWYPFLLRSLGRCVCLPASRFLLDSSHPPPSYSSSPPP